MDTEIEDELDSLRGKLAAAVAEDTKQVAHLQARIERNRTLLSNIRSSLNTYRPNSGNAAANDGTKADKILEAISSLTKSPFTGDDVLVEINRLFPDARIERKAVSSIMWKMLSRGRAKNFRQASKGKGRQPSFYEKVSAKVRVRTLTESNDLLPKNGTEAHRI